MRVTDDTSAGRAKRLGVFVTALLIVVGAVAGYAVIMGQARLLTDEGAHASQIWLFAGDKPEILAVITMIPTYHAIQALIQRVTGLHDVASLRLINLLG